MDERHECGPHHELIGQRDVVSEVAMGVCREEVLWRDVLIAETDI